MSNYSRGAAFERATRHDLEDNGYEVIRSAGSKGKVDLVAFKTGQIVFVQNKINGLCAPDERARVRELAAMVGAVPVVAYSHKDGRAAAVIRYRELTGDGPKEFVPWFADLVGGTQDEYRMSTRIPGLKLSERLDAEGSVTVSGGDTR